MAKRKYHGFNRIKIRIAAGAEIGQVIRESLDLANQYNCPVKFKFNSTPVAVNPQEEPSEAYKRWARARGYE